MPAGWWQASDGKWYPPHQHPGAYEPLPPQRRSPIPALPKSRLNGWMMLGIFAALAGLALVVWFWPPPPQSLSSLPEFAGTGAAVPVSGYTVPATPALAAHIARTTFRVVGLGCDPGGYSHGSGWPVAPKYVVTASHVAAGMKAMEIQAPNNVDYTAVTVAIDPAIDYAVLYVPEGNFQPFPISSHDVTAGTGIAAGYPGEGPESVVVAKLQGIHTVSMEYPSEGFKHLSVQYTADGFGPGVSGGPVFDSTGDVIGMSIEGSGTTIFGVLPTQMRAPIVAAIGQTGGVNVGHCALTTT